MTSIYSNFNLNGNFNISGIGFKSIPNIPPLQMPAPKDGYVSNPLYENLGTKAEIEAKAKSNPRIREIMSERNLPIKVNEQELQNLKSGHLQNTRITAAKIYSNLPDDLKRKVNPKVLQDAAMLHDYGKVLIPENILNKSGNLTEEEWDIMQQHSELGAELLKGSNIDNRAIELVKYHHQNAYHTGYPDVDYEFEYGLDSEILSVADKFEALCEKRSYKDEMSKEEALAVIENDVENGYVSPEVYEALKRSI